MEACCKIINMRHSTHFQVSSFNRWKAWETANISKAEFFHTLDEAWFKWPSIPPTEEKLADKIGRLIEFSQVDIVTGRSPETVSSAESWLENQKIKFNTFIRTDSVMDKADLNYDVFIDDSPELMSALASKPNCHAILYTQPWNKDTPEMPRILRAQSWDQIPTKVLGLLNEK
jgi:hypothetical protein